jgi:hypothetical protein
VLGLSFMDQDKEIFDDTVAMRAAELSIRDWATRRAKRQLKWLPADGQHFFLTWLWRCVAPSGPRARGTCGSDLWNNRTGVSVSGTRHTRAGYPSDLLNRINPVS